MKNTKKKNGISLIVLVITIIVMIILASSIILSISNSGIIGQANKAKKDTDISSMREVAGVAVAEYELEVSRGTTTKTKKEYVEEYLAKQGLTLPEGYEVTDEGQVASSLIWDGTVATSFASGTGTEADPYIIETASELAYLAEYTKSNNAIGKYFKLINDIDLNNIEWNVIGSNNSGDGRFGGTFDGQNHKILNLKISENNKSRGAGSGLFGYNDGTIKNIILECGSIKISSYKVGGICGCNTGLVQNCINKVSIFATTSYMVGGIAGENVSRAQIIGCVNEGTISRDQSEYVGDICGSNEGTIE